MTDTTHPPDEIVGSVRNVQEYLRNRYDATEAEIDTRDVTNWEERHQGDEKSTKGSGLEYLSRNIDLTGRDETVIVTLRWHYPDIPADDSEPAVIQHHEYLTDALEELTDDFPEADVSTRASTETAKATLRWSPHD